MVQGDLFYAVLHGEGLATVILPASDFQLAGQGSNAACGCGRQRSCRAA